MIDRNPDYYRPYNQLAMALARRARETADSDYYRQALAAVEASLERKPGNYGARKARVWCLLGQHEFSQALEEAKALNKLALDDVQVYGFLADAYTELGHYHQANADRDTPGSGAGLGGHVAHRRGREDLLRRNRSRAHLRWPF